VERLGIFDWYKPFEIQLCLWLPQKLTEVNYLCGMARIMAVDYGTKRVGLAVSDPLQIIATGLDTISTPDIFTYLKKYLAEEEVEVLVVGMPLHLDGNPAQIADKVNQFINRFQKLFPNIKVETRDERFTSEDAKLVIRQSGAKKKKRRDKALVDKVAAVLILQDYMESLRYS
jgi:putative Holliday junction resolvase